MAGMAERIYLDWNATTPLRPEAKAAMAHAWEVGGNPSSVHAEGREARRLVEDARTAVAAAVGAEAQNVIFTSGGTEANSLALTPGLRRGKGPAAERLLVSAIEHASVLSGGRFAAEATGHIGVTRAGVVDLDRLRALLDGPPALVSIMLANNETGAIQPVGALAGLGAERGIRVHTDAVQAVGRIPVDFHALGVATLAASAHKFHGPVGVGVLLVRKGVRLGSRLFGGGQQQGRRPGTIAVALAVGFAAALEKWHRVSAARAARWVALRDRLEAGLIAALGPECVIRNGPTREDVRLPQTLNVGFPGLDGDALLMQLDLAGIAASLGSACASGSTRPSPTLMAMRVPDDRLRSSVRFSLGAATTEAEVDEAVRRIVGVVERSRATRIADVDL
jgi:cysteine desulfurase